MSFSSDIKEELCRIRIRQESQKLAVLSGLTQTCGSLRLSQIPLLVYQSELPCVTRLAEALARQLYQMDASAGFQEQEHRILPLSVVALSGPDCKKLLLDTGVLGSDGSGLLFEKQIPSHILSHEDARRCFFRGLFLGSGSCSDPATGYHLEIGIRTEEFAEQVVQAISEDSVRVKRSSRKGRHFIYVSGDDVSAFLALIGASSSALKLEDVRAVKDYRNYINRTSNCETANIDKTVRASIRQTAAIECLERHINLNELPQPLYEAVRLRLQYPEAPLQELADRAGIGKSGMNHRFIRILELARTFEEIL